MSQESMRTLKLFILFIVIKVTKSKKSYCNPQNDFCVVASCQGITTCFQALLCPGIQRLKRMWWKVNRHNVSVQCFLRLKKINITSGISGITYCRRGSLLFHTCIYFFNCYDIDTVIWPQLSVTSSPLHCLMLVVWAGNGVSSTKGRKSAATQPWFPPFPCSPVIAHQALHSFNLPSFSIINKMPYLISGQYYFIFLLSCHTRFYVDLSSCLWVQSYFTLQIICNICI